MFLENNIYLSKYAVHVFLTKPIFLMVITVN